MNITVVGAGYVGLSIAVLLAQKNRVIAVDTREKRVEMINKRTPYIKGKYLEKYLTEKNLNLTATMDANSAYCNADYIIVAVPTNYDDKLNHFDASIVESVIGQAVKINPNAIIVIKSTIPIGFTDRIRKKLNSTKIIFSPEFLRESKSLYDNLYPGRIIVSTDLHDKTLTKAAEKFASLLKECSLKDNIETIVMGFKEAESVKLFVNSYLAMRVGFFNELDIYAETNGLNTEQIIHGVCSDPRVGNHYNNPSFGYGGYCLPKDTKQLKSNYNNIPQSLINAIVETNRIRKDYVANKIIQIIENYKNEYLKQDIKNSQITVGIYRLIMKSGSDNFRSSSIIDIMQRLKNYGVNLLIYEPTLENNSDFSSSRVTTNLEEFKNESKIILANRYNEELDDVRDKVYCRDLFQRD